MDITVNTVFYCKDCKRAVVSTEEEVNCPECNRSMKETGTIGCIK